MTASANDPRKFFRGSVAISGGRISSVLPATPDNGSDDRGTESENRSRRVIDAGGKLLMPGLINLHNHVAMSLMRNYADDLPLMEWLADRVWPFEAKLTGDDVYLGARLGIAEMLLGGTTTFVDMYWHADRVAEAVLESGMRAVVCPAFIDTNYEAFERETVRLVERYAGADGGRLGVRIAPAVTLIGCTTFVLTLVGVWVGNLFGSRYKSRAELTGGIILILIGVKILLEHLGVLG